MSERSQFLFQGRKKGLSGMTRQTLFVFCKLTLPAKEFDYNLF